ncbi:substrate-binding periplasmic protein [Parachitinimonas caeni]|uniref:Transporter substrate-binding domain-containing protein n=1 Tax=Parachitinimonas caeni TaxID=3031301 RepID=A0ABT7DZY6_9NEIS|nr:transporter substrate-binding domain-containing protein [Parachitinimonas caeni]MDK2125606.1 transporter substrate-binding domain-containing protein [Parachitinimonas caeni]
MTARYALSLLALCCSTSVLAAGKPKEITCYSDTFAPYVLSADGKITGIDVDTIDEVGKRIGVKINFKLLPWVRLEEDIKKGAGSEVECAYAYGRTPEREAYMDFTTVPLHVTAYTLFARKDANIAYKSLADMKGKSVGLRRGFKAPPEFEEAVKSGQIKVEEIDKDEQNLQKLSSGRIDAILTNQDVGRYTAGQLKISNIMPLSPPVKSTPTFLIFNKAKGHAGLAAEFDKALKAIQADKTYEKLYDKYM